MDQPAATGDTRFVITPPDIVGLPIAVTGVFQGMLLFFLLACDVLVRYRIVPARARVA